MYVASGPVPDVGRVFRLRVLLLILLLLALATLSAGAAAPKSAPRDGLAQIRATFVENCGQWDERVTFAAKTGFGTAFVTQDGQIVYSFAGVRTYVNPSGALASFADTTAF